MPRASPRHLRRTGARAECLPGGMASDHRAEGGDEALGALWRHHERPPRPESHQDEVIRAGHVEVEQARPGVEPPEPTPEAAGADPHAPAELAPKSHARDGGRL